MRIQHTFRTETYDNNKGSQIPVTLCSYHDDAGNPMMASLHGHLHVQIVTNMLKAYRASDARLVR
jgi:hypothetical protein